VSVAIFKPVKEKCKKNHAESFSLCMAEEKIPLLQRDNPPVFLFSQAPP
jgi:hypothetical protein